MTTRTFKTGAIYATEQDPWWRYRRCEDGWQSLRRDYKGDFHFFPDTDIQNITEHWLSLIRPVEVEE